MTTQAVWMDEGLLYLATFLKIHLNGGASPSLHLFTNDIEPEAGQELSDYTEATFDGYAPITLSDWQSAFIAPNGAARLNETVRVFTRTGGAVESVYGYYLTDDETSLLFAAQRDPDAPVVMSGVGQEYAVLPVIDTFRRPPPP